MTETISASDYQAMLAKQAQPDKGRVRGTKRVTVQGIKFHSVRESKRWLLLRDREKRGEIMELQLQVPILLQGQNGPILTPTGRQMIYKADFQYFDNVALRWVIEDAKGHETDTFIMKRAILAAMGVEVELV